MDKAPIVVNVTWIWTEIPSRIHGSWFSFLPYLFLHVLAMGKNFWNLKWSLRSIYNLQGFFLLTIMAPDSRSFEIFLCMFWQWGKSSELKLEDPEPAPEKSEMPNILIAVLGSLFCRFVKLLTSSRQSYLWKSVHSEGEWYEPHNLAQKIWNMNSFWRHC